MLPIMHYPKVRMSYPHYVLVAYRLYVIQTKEEMKHRRKVEGGSKIWVLSTRKCLLSSHELRRKLLLIVRLLGVGQRKRQLGLSWTAAYQGFWVRATSLKPTGTYEGCNLTVFINNTCLLEFVLITIAFFRTCIFKWIILFLSTPSLGRQSVEFLHIS